MPIEDDSIESLISQLEELHFREKRILAAIKSRTAAAGQATGGQSRAINLEDRVRITNRVIIRGRETTPRDLVGRVVKITAHRIHILTDSSHYIERSPRNVQVIIDVD